jgi:hypothetical protein
MSNCSSFKRTIQPLARKNPPLYLLVIHPSVPMGLIVMSRFDGLGNAQLLVDLKELVERDHVLEAELISHLGEVDARRLYLEQGCSSMFDYSVRVLRFSECVAYKRIGVARAARKFSVVVEAISRGELHLSAASLIAPHLSEETVEGWLEAARHKKSREVRQLVADRFPRKSVRSSVRRAASATRLAGLEGMASSREAVQTSTVDPEIRRPIATTSLISSEASESPSASAMTGASTHASADTEALGAQRFSVRFTADEEVHYQLQELRSLLRHSVPDGDVGKILARAIGVLLKQVRKRKIGECDSPRSPRAAGLSQASSSTKKKSSRHIPVVIRREVWARDKGKCTFESKGGRGCESREAVEFHHRVPWARCNEHTLDNIALRCRSHNQHEAELDFGARHMDRFRREARTERSRCGIDPREDADSRANTDLAHQLDSNPVQAVILKE